MEPSVIITEIEKILGKTLHLAPARGGDALSGVMPCSGREPFRYAIQDNQLVGLNLAGAKLTDAQWQEICKLFGSDIAHLEALNLRDNQLTQSPVPGAMKNLRYLDLSGNQLKELVLPEGNEELEHIWLYKNPELATPPPEIVKQGRQAIFQYFRAINRNRGTAKRIYEAKMLILGEGGAGKTSLARRLINRTAVMPTKEESTRGIEILSYEFKTPAGDTFLLKLWDFAGQDIYHAIHQLFLTKRSLYILVDSTRFGTTDVPDNTFYYWFRVAELFGDNSPLLLVQNEVANRSKDINFKGYSNTFTFVKERFPVNIDSNRGLEAFSKAVEKYAMELPHVGELWSKEWLNARAALEKRAEEEPYILYEAYEQTIAKQGITNEEEAKTLSDFLHHLGVILHFKDDPILKHLVILRNQWATDAVYKVLDCEKVKNRLGQFTQQDVDEIWKDTLYKFRKLELLALMERFELCYPLKETGEPTWLATQLLPEEAPNIPWDNYKNTVVRYDFAFFMPKGLVPRFIVRNNQYVSNIGHAWKYGVEMTSGQTAAKITASYAINSIEIRVNNRGDFRAFLVVLMEDMDRLLKSFGERLQVEKMLPCACPQCVNTPVPHFFKYSSLQRRMEMPGKDTIECEKSALDIAVKPFLDSFFGKKQAAKKIFISYSRADEAYLQELKKRLSPIQRQGVLQTWDVSQLMPGEEGDASTRRELQTADIILLLVSPDFMANEDVWNEEMKSAMERHEKDEIVVVPIIIRPSLWQDAPFAKFNALPAKGVPISSWSNADEAWLEVVKKIKLIARQQS